MALQFRLQPALIASVAFLAGRDQVADFYSCSNPDKDHVDAQGEPDPCHKMDPAPEDNQPGSCQPSGGTPYGEAKPTDPSTFCCLE